MLHGRIRTYLHCYILILIVTLDDVLLLAKCSVCGFQFGLLVLHRASGRYPGRDQHTRFPMVSDRKAWYMVTYIFVLARTRGTLPSFPVGRPVDDVLWLKHLVSDACSLMIRHDVQGVSAVVLGVDFWDMGALGCRGSSCYRSLDRHRFFRIGHPDDLG